MNARQHRLSIFVFGLLTTTTTLRASDQDWPQWRGANGEARAASFMAPKTWPKTLAQKWKVSVGDGVATPSLVGDKLYVFSRQQNNEVLRCMSVADGKEIWQDKYEARGADGPAAGFSGPRCSPAVADGKVLTIGVRGMLTCHDAANGKRLWQKDDFRGATPRFQTSASPLIVDALCIAQLGDQSNGAIAAYDLTTGEQKWKWTGDSPSYASPALMTVDGVKLIIGMTEQRIVAVSAVDGKQVWQTPFAAQGMGAYNAATPVVDGQTLIYSGGGRGTRAVKIEKSTDGFTGKELWANADKSVQFNTPVLKEGLLYGLSASNELFCLDAQTGKTAWTTQIGAVAGGMAGGRPGGGPPGGGAAGSGGPPNGPPGGRPGGGRGRGGGGGRGGYGSIVDAGSVLLALTPSSELIAFAPDGKAYTELAKIKVADSPTYAYPVLSGKRIFVKDQDALTLFTVD